MNGFDSYRVRERADIARAISPLADIVVVPDTAFDGAALLVSIAGAGLVRAVLHGARR